MKPRHKILKISVLILAVVLLVTAVSFFLLLEPGFPVRGWQKLDAGKLTNAQRTIRLLDDDDRMIADSIYEKNKVFTPISKIPRQTTDAFVSIEDKRFYKHSGIDYLRVFGALKTNLFSRSFKEGASTITQQLIKNTHLNNEKTVSRKIQEMRIARAIERKYSKPEIMEMYLNILYFGNNLYGIGSASEMMFQKTPEKLSLEESALLAGIINNPSKYNPYRNPENAHKRKNLVLEQMLKLGKITQEQYKEASNKKIVLQDLKVNSNQYINGVVKEAGEILGCKEEDLFRYNYTIGTNLKSAYQKAISCIMSDIVPGDGIISHALVLENETGKVIADFGYTPLNLAFTKRQPGSTIKPLLCYAPALEKKLIYPASPILDEKTTFGNYSPENYRKKYCGWTNATESLKQSLNIPAVKLLNDCGIEYAKSFVRNCGISFAPEDRNLSIALGGMTQGVTLRQIANAYQTFANRGSFIKSDYIDFIRDRNGTLLYQRIPAQKKVYDDDTAFLITAMLKECAKSGTAKKLTRLKNVAAKTGTVGTADGNSDAYCVAYTPDYTVAVWFGSKDNKTATQISGGGYPTIAAGKIIERLRLNRTEFICPATVLKLDIDIRERTENHKVVLAGTDIEPRYRKNEYFSIGNLPKEYSYNRLPDMFLEEFEKLDLDNFEITDRFVQ